MKDRDLLERAWEVDEPPSDFAERVVSRALGERRESLHAPSLPSPSDRGKRYAIVALGLVAAAALIFWWQTDLFAGAGERIATARTEVALGRRALAVLETGAHVRWDGPRVEQDRGDVFYRVEPGRRFVVKTPVGEVAVLGTCFRVRVAPADPGGSDVKRKDALMTAGGAALGALVVVTVYEGRVQLSHAKEKLELHAGESGKLSSDGAKRVEGGELAEAEQAISDSKRSSLADANENLASDIAELNRKLKSIQKDKTKLEEQLKTSEAELARRTDAGAARSRSEFDLDQTDWAELAKDGKVKYRVPCFRPNGWKAGAEGLDELGLAPDDEEPIRAAYQRSYERIWKTLRPLCVKAVGNEQAVDVLGPETCIHVIVDVARKKDRDAADEAMRLLAEVRAGQKPAPVAPLHPTYEAFSAMTAELGKFEADLAQSFGAEEAHRLAYSDKMCAGHSTFGGRRPRSGPAK